MNLRVNLGYGIGQACDTIPYCMFYTFFIYFLTDNVGMPPMLAGAVSLIAVCWDGITDPIIGYLTDHSKNPKGRRRPWMIRTVLPLAISVFLIFAPFEFSSNTIAAIYYIAMSMVFWTMYTAYVIPYMSLGAELTTDYNGRNYIRMFNMIFGGLFMLLCTSGPTVVQGWGMEAGMSDRTAWGISGAIFGVIALICGIISWKALDGKELTAEELAEAGMATEESDDNIFKTMKETLSIRPYRQLCISTFLLMCGNILSASATVYLISYNCEMDYGQQAIFWFVYAIAYIACVPIGSAFANTMGKKASWMIGLGFTAVCLIAMFIWNHWNFTTGLIFVCIYQLGSTCFWTNYLAFAYDCAEIDEYKNGKRREGSLCAVVSFAQKLGSAIGTYGTGTVLALVGYDAMAEVQTDTALLGINGASTLSMAIAAIVAMICMAKYPVGKKEYDLIVKAVEDKKAGKVVDETPFKHCL